MFRFLRLTRWRPRKSIVNKLNNKQLKEKRTEKHMKPETRSF